jgi:regulator of sigma E protease
MMVWFISIVLALFNLLPIPALDGGRLVFLLYEIVTRRRVDQRVENLVHLVGFVLLFGLLVAVTLFGDLARLFQR